MQAHLHDNKMHMIKLKQMKNSNDHLSGKGSNRGRMDANQTLYRIAIKAGLNCMAEQMLYTYTL